MDGEICTIGYSGMNYRNVRGMVSKEIPIQMLWERHGIDEKDLSEDAIVVSYMQQSSNIIDSINLLTMLFNNKKPL